MNNMTKAAERPQGNGPKNPADSQSKRPGNWPDIPDDPTLENVDNEVDDRAEQMRHADDSDAIANITTDTGDDVKGYTDALVDEELDRNGGREELI